MRNLNDTNRAQLDHHALSVSFWRSKEWYCNTFIRKHCAQNLHRTSTAFLNSVIICFPIEKLFVSSLECLKVHIVFFCTRVSARHDLFSLTMVHCVLKTLELFEWQMKHNIYIYCARVGIFWPFDNFAFCHQGIKTPPYHSMSNFFPSRILSQPINFFILTPIIISTWRFKVIMFISQ